MGLTQITTGGVDDNINIDSNTLKVDGTNNRVGIGKTSPNFKLDVNGEVGITEGQRLSWHDGAGGRSSSIFGGSGDVLAFTTTSSNAERMRLDSSGRLLVGVSTAQASQQIQAANTGGENFGAFRFANNTGPSDIALHKSRGSLGSHTIVQNNDVIGSIAFRGSDGSAFRNAAMIDGQVDGTPGSSDMPGRLVFKTTADGASSPTERMRISSSGRFFFNETSSDLNHKYILSGNESSDLAAFQYNSNTGTYLAILAGPPNGIVEIKADARSGSFPPLTFKTGANERMRIDSSGRLLVGTSTEHGGHLFQVQDGDASLTKLVAATGGNAVQMLRFRVQNSGTQGASLGGISAETVSGWGGQLTFHTKPANGSPNETVTERMRIDDSGEVLIGTTSGFSASNSSATGHRIEPEGTASHYRNSGTGLYVGRQGNDGVLINLRKNGSEEGTISVSGSTVSYNGGHLARWSQLAGGAERTEILRGSVLSNLDEMCEWGEEDNEQLNRMKVSDVEGDRNVSGVFQAWDDDDDTYTNDFYCAMTGDFVIRIAQGTTVARGDLLMSAGDGTAKPQDDDIVRSKTIAKVTSTTVSTTYSDGSYCVPCVLMAC